MAVPWLRQFFAGISPRPRFAPKSVDVGFLVVKVALTKTGYSPSSSVYKLSI